MRKTFYLILLGLLCSVGMAWANGTITAAATTDLGSGKTPRYVVEVEEVGRLMKNKTGSSAWSLSNDALTTGSSMFALQTYNEITGIVVYGSGTGNNRTLSKVEVGSNTSNYAEATASAYTDATDDGKFTTSGTADSMKINFASNVAENSYVAITFSGNVNITSVEFVYASTDPSISAEDVSISATATSGSIAYTINNPVEGGAVTATKKTEADWLLTVGTGASPIAFTTQTNNGAERSATVTLTYTYNTNQTVKKDVTITQAAPKYDITYNGGTYGTGTIDGGKKSYGVDFTLSSSTFTRPNYIQTGWALTDGGAKAYDLGGSYTTNATQTFYPVWTRGIESTVTYNLTTNSSSTTLDNCSSATPTSGAIVASTTINTYGTAGCDGTASAKTDETQKLKIDAEYTAANYYEWTFTISSNATFLPTQVVMKFQAVSGLTQYKVEITDGTTGYSTNFVQTTSAGGTLETLTWNVPSEIALAAGTTGKLKLWAYKKESKATAFRLGSPITIKGVLDETMAVTKLADRTYGTYVTSKGLDFTDVDDMEAYIATGLNGAKTAVDISKVTKVPAGTAIIVKTSDQATTSVNVPVTTTATASDVAGNLLVSGEAEGLITIDVDHDTYTYYYLASDHFHKATSGTLVADKAYLKVSGSPLLAPSLRIGFGEENATNLDAIEAVEEGVKFIQNGQLYIKRNGVIYDALGHKVQ